MKNKRAFFLPVVLILIAIAAVSIYIIWRFGWSTRSAVRKAEEAIHCQQAAASAITEVRRKIEASFGAPSADWEPFFQELLPAMSDKLPEAIPMDAHATIAAFDKVANIDTVLVECLDKRVQGGMAQGLLSFWVRTTPAGDDASQTEFYRVDRVRYVVVRHPQFGLQLVLLPGVESSKAGAL